MQLAVSKCLDATTDVAAYDANRKLLYNALTEYGFECAKPEGLFIFGLRLRKMIRHLLPKEKSPYFNGSGKCIYVSWLCADCLLCGSCDDRALAPGI